MKLKKTITAILSITMILSLMLCLTGCGNQKKDEAIDAFNKTTEIFDDTADLINKNIDALDDETVSAYQELSTLLSQYKELLEGDSEISDEKYDEMIDWFQSTEQMLKDTKEEIESSLSTTTE